MTAGSFAGRRCVVVGGAGAVGGMFARLLVAAGGDVCIVDVREPAEACSCAFVRGDATAPDARLAAELAAAELVILAVPEQVALAAIDGVAAALRPRSLLVDTTSVKSEIVAALGARASHLEAVSLNPMFAPSLGLDGHAVAAVVVGDGPRVQGLLSLLGEHGARVIRLGAEEHDALTAATQALTHATVLAFGLALADLGVDAAKARELAPPPHATLLALLARIGAGAPETYWDVQAGNPHAPYARAALARALRRLGDVVDAGNDAEFDALLRRACGALDRERDHFQALCTRLFHTLASAPRAEARQPVLSCVLDER